MSTGAGCLDMALYSGLPGLWTLVCLAGLGALVRRRAWLCLYTLTLVYLDPRMAGWTLDSCTAGGTLDSYTAGGTLDPRPRTAGRALDPDTAGSTLDPRMAGRALNSYTAGWTLDPRTAGAFLLSLLSYPILLPYLYPVFYYPNHVIPLIISRLSITLTTLFPLLYPTFMPIYLFNLWDLYLCYSLNYVTPFLSP
jgi:hypothetical protein